MKTILFIASATAAFAVIVAVTAQTPQHTPPFASNAFVTRPGAELPPFGSPAAMQAEFTRRFEASPGFGLSRVVRPVFLAPVPELVWNGATSRVVPPALISLEDDPIAYAPREHNHAFALSAMGTNVTRREVRKLFTHRPLTALETNAVLALRGGRDLVVLTNRVFTPEPEFERLVTAPELFVLGALRAGKTCAACHQCEQGTLLGAFAYTLAPIAPPTDTGTNSPASRSNLVARLPFPRNTLRSIQ